MRDRFLQQEVWERMGVPVKEAISVIMATPDQQLFQQMLFAKIVPELPQARPARRRRRLAARPLHRARRHRVRALEPTPSAEYEDFALTDADLRSA